MRLLTTGAPASGKTSIARCLAEVWELKYVGVGDMLSIRASLRDAEAMKRGEFASCNSLIRSWVEEQVQGCDRIVVDGYPRLAEHLRGFRFSLVDAVVWVEASWAMCRERAERRRRSADHRAAFERRYEDYVEYTVPLHSILVSQVGIRLVRIRNEGCLDATLQNLLLELWAIETIGGGRARGGEDARFPRNHGACRKG